MPRTSRSVEAGGLYHVLNRGNGRMCLFHKPEDYAAFVKVLGEGLARYPVELLAWCLMPNHWHLVLRPAEPLAMGRLMGWVGVTHVRRHHEHYHSRGGGHLYQGRFKSFPIQDDKHFLTVCRYVEGNALRGKLVDRAEQWQWSSLYQRKQRQAMPPLAQWPVDRPRGWNAVVNEAIPKDQIKSLRVSVNRGRPFGQESWIQQTARRMGLQFTLRDAGRPRKAPKTGEVNSAVAKS